VVGIGNVSFAHIHGPAAPGASAGVILNLCGTGAPAPACVSGTGVLASGIATPIATVTFDSLLGLLRTNQAYVNVHTSPAHPGGEIRGTVVAQ